MKMAFPDRRTLNVLTTTPLFTDFKHFVLAIQDLNASIGVKESDGHRVRVQLGLLGPTAQSAREQVCHRHVLL
jgi:hypothetical protein